MTISMLKRSKLTPPSFKISEHTSSFVKAQQSLEAAIEAAKEAIKAGSYKNENEKKADMVKMNKE